MTEWFYGWIPVISGSLRYSDAQANRHDSANLKMLCVDSHHSTFNLPNFQNHAPRMLKIALWVRHKDESFLIRHWRDLALRVAQHFPNIRLSKVIRSREKLYLIHLKLDQVNATQAVGTWYSIPGERYRSQTKNASSFDLMDQNGTVNTSVPVSVIAQGDAIVSRSGFVYFSIKQAITPTVDWRKTANQFYYAIKDAFHRHKYHDQYADGILQCYPLAVTNGQSPNIHDVSAASTILDQADRVSRRLCRFVATYLSGLGLTNTTAAKAEGFIAYTQALGGSVVVRSELSKINAPDPLIHSFLERHAQTVAAVGRAVAAKTAEANARIARRSSALAVFFAVAAILLAVMSIYADNGKAHSAAMSEQQFHQFSAFLFETFAGISKEERAPFTWALLLSLLPVSLAFVSLAVVRGESVRLPGYTILVKWFGMILLRCWSFFRKIWR